MRLIASIASNPVLLALGLGRVLRGLAGAARLVPLGCPAPVLGMPDETSEATVTLVLTGLLPLAALCPSGESHLFMGQLEERLWPPNWTPN